MFSCFLTFLNTVGFVYQVVVCRRKAVQTLPVSLWHSVGRTGAFFVEPYERHAVMRSRRTAEVSLVSNVPSKLCSGFGIFGRVVFRCMESQNRSAVWREYWSYGCHMVKICYSFQYPTNFMDTWNHSTSILLVQQTLLCEFKLISIWCFV